ncbi:VanZ family protein [Pseudarthrobacter sp. NamE5]|uniref:VanZ family protein n=1 Tax=Pseudarthrobacter sp. NamE5 TaxID=2576839 RepID=UPI00110B9586|nr:VanZ family protein [Pseudarthrobacter sp. NamE5]TLM81679.1 VanZ family protein [Pseudarthrobacter sp. NamE5]
MKLLENVRLWRLVLIAMMIPLALIAFWPTPVDQPIQGLLTRLLRFLHRNGIPDWFSYTFVEASANVALFIPIGFISSLAFPKKPWWRIGAFGLLISGLIELGQLLFLQDRFASPGDLVTNASGAVIGALLVTAVLKKLQVRRLPAADL